MRFSSEDKIRFGYGAAFILLLIAFSYSVFTTNQLLYHIRWVSKTNKILHNLEALLLELKDIDASFQNNIPVDTVQYGGYYEQSFNSIDSLCMLIRHDVGDDFVPNLRLKEIDEYIDQVRRHILVTAKGNPKDIDISGDLKSLQEIESRIIDMQTAEKALLTLRSQRLNSSSGSMAGINIAIVVIALLLVGYSLVVFNNENNEKKGANRKMIGYSQELEKKISELTVANTELSQLRGLQKFTATGRIARMIAHEVRNPLTNINLSCDQLKDLTDKNAHAVMLLDTIMRNSNRINQLVSELLNATKSQELKFRNVSINDILDETLEIAKDRIQLEHIQVVKSFEADICNVEVDVDKIKIAFLNIILNAVEAIDSANGVLTLKTESRNNKCIVKISDNGHGIEPDSLDKIFEPYYTGKSKGNGLGLTNTQNIILNHKGTVTVESEVGKGTTIIVELDFSKRENEEVFSKL